VSLVVLLLFVAGGLGSGAVAFAAFLTAVSPAMVFYSRYYIQEMLLVCFTFGAIVSGYRYTRSKNIIWALAAGVFLGLMHATKETCIIAFGAMFLALLLTLLLQREKGSLASAVAAAKPSHLIAGVVAGLAVSFLFYSSFLSHPEGVLDSFRTYAAYFKQAGGDNLHDRPWYYYLNILLYFKYGQGPIWTEAVIVLLAVVGFIAAMVKKELSFADIRFVRFIAFYTLVMMAIYSAIPYKTPWCLLGFLHGMILLAGVGAVVLVKSVPNVLPRLIVLCLLFEATAYLTWQAYQCNYEYYADSCNPYVYAHPTNEIFTVVEKIEEYASVHDRGHDMPIDVICPGDDYWPLPWYLRSFTAVHWWNHVVEDAPSAPLIIASPDVEAALTNKLYVETPQEQRHMYMFLFDKPYYVWLRPAVKLVGFVRKDLWTAYNEKPAVLPQEQAEEQK